MVAAIDARREAALRNGNFNRCSANVGTQEQAG
jgi:hypothetical protein